MGRFSGFFAFLKDLRRVSIFKILSLMALFLLRKICHSAMVLLMIVVVFAYLVVNSSLRTEIFVDEDDCRIIAYDGA